MQKYFSSKMNKYEVNAYLDISTNEVFHFRIKKKTIIL